MPEGHRHLTHEERCQIGALKESGLSDSNSHQPFQTPYSMGFRDPGFVNFSCQADGNRPESSGHHRLGPLPHP